MSASRGLSDSTQDSAGRRSVFARLRKQLPAAGIVLTCAVYVIAAVLANANVAADDAPIPGGVETDADSVVISIDTRSLAYAEGVRLGWYLAAVEPTKDTDYYQSPEGAVRPVSTRPLTVPIDKAVRELQPAFIFLGLVLLLVLLRMRRAALAAAVAAAAIAAPFIGARFGYAGDALTLVPVGLAAGAIHEDGFGIGLAMPKLRPYAAFATRFVLPWVALPAAGLVVGTLVSDLALGAGAAVVILFAMACLAMLRWEIATARSGEGSSSKAVARAVLIDMVPFGRRIWRSSAEMERRRLASDLHAEVLPAIASTADALERSGATAEAERLRDLATSVRDIVSARNLPLLDDFGLVAAAEWLAERLEDRTDIEVELDLSCDPTIRRQPAVEKAAFRVLQLALENVIRHSGAHVAHVMIAGAADSLELRIADDGKGVDATIAARGKPGHFGMSDMRSEADAIGATLKVTSVEPHGTVVTLKWRG